MNAAGRRVCIILNRKAGTARGRDARQLADEITEPFRELRDEVESHVCSPREIAGAVAAIKKDSRLDIIVICGGDGTLSRCASDLRDHAAALGFIPLGTLNLFARSLRMPGEPAEAARAIATATPRRIDTGRVNDNLFLHHVSFGLHPKLLRLREKFAHRSRLGKVLASLRAFLLAARQPPHLHLELDLDGNRRVCESPALVFSNNPFGSGHLPYPDYPDSGQLGVYQLTGKDWRTVTKAGADAVFGRMHESPEIQCLTAREAQLFPRGKRGPSVRASIDGELVRLRLPAKIEISAASLTVLAPEGAGNGNGGGT